jgi:hypothetical protein
MVSILSVHKINILCITDTDLLDILLSKNREHIISSIYKSK